jgi:hypothetical protein
MGRGSLKVKEYRARATKSWLVIGFTQRFPWAITMMLSGMASLATGLNAFQEFAHCLYEETKKAVPQFSSLWAKWDREDLIPFLSDFDSRLVCRSGMMPEHWVELDRVTGELHLDITRRHPEWARILEHTPGVTVTHEEVLDESLFHPETQQWSLYLGDHEWYPVVEDYHQTRVWGRRHEFYFLKRFLYFYGPYIHGIDPPINLGQYEHKYALHSRFWHYFVPALQAALSLVERRSVRGKFETLDGWLEHFPAEPILLKVQAGVQAHYEMPELTDQAALLKLEEDLHLFLQKVMEVVKESITIVDTRGPIDIRRYKQEMQETPVDPMMIIYDGVRFSRIRKGRYYFYLNSPDFFSADRLVASEIKWLQDYFTEPLFKAYGKLRLGQSNYDLEGILGDLRGRLIVEQEEMLIRKVFGLSFDSQSKGQERRVLESLMAVYQDYHIILEHLLRDAKAIDRSKPKGSRAPSLLELSEGT